MEAPQGAQKRLFSNGFGSFPIAQGPLLGRPRAPSRDFQRLPETSRDFQRLPETCGGLRGPAATCSDLQRPAATCSDLQRPAAACSGLQRPAASRSSAPVGSSRGPVGIQQGSGSTRCAPREDFNYIPHENLPFSNGLTPFWARLLRGPARDDF